MRQLISLPENASLKSLIPSRRHHPQMEPLLATYKICYIKRWLNHFWSLQETIFIAKNVISWRLMKTSCPLFNLHCCFPFEMLKISYFHREKTAAKSHFFPSSTQKLTFILFLFPPMKFLYFSWFPFFHSWKSFYKV